MNIDKTVRNLSLLGVRLVLGSSIAAHGAQKMYGAFNGPGLEGASHFMNSLGFQPGERYARASSTAEMSSGALIALGALGPLGPAILLSVMITAVETVHRPKGYWNQEGGFEMNTMYALLALLLATQGYGSYSLDALLGIDERATPSFGWLALAGGATAALMMLGQRTPPGQQQTTTTQTTTETSETETPATVS